MPVAGRIVYEFSGFRLDPLQRSLVTIADDRPVALTAKVFDALLFFIEHRGDLLDKHTLMQALWPSVVVEDNNLNQIISALRKGLGDTPGEHRYIVTVAGRGYRFVAEVTARDPSDTTYAAAPRETQRLPESASDRAPHASIAVLPFVNLTGDPGKEYLSDGLAEELIGTLGRISDLRVPARTSSFAYKRREIDVRQIARELDTAVVLEGAVRSAGERIRATVQLVDGESGYQLWSRAYDRRYTDLFDLQDELANEIVRALSDYLQVTLPSAVGNPASIRDLPTYELYLQGRSLLIDRFGADSVLIARRLLRQALERYPSFARAHSTLAVCDLWAFSAGFSPGASTLADATRSARRALEIEPDLGESRAVLAQLGALRCDWIGARREFEAALNLDRRDPVLHGTYFLMLTNVGHLHDALKFVREADRLAPGSFKLEIAITCSLMGLDLEAERNAEQAVSRGASPEHIALALVHVHAAYRRGDVAQAANRMIEALPAELRNASGGSAVGRIYEALGDPTRSSAGLAALQELRSMIDASRPVILSLLLMQWHTLLRDLDGAYDVANALVDEFEASGILSGPVWGGLWLPEMQEFRADPRFQALADTLRLTEYWREYGPPDGCELRDGRLVTVSG